MREVAGVDAGVEDFAGGKVGFYFVEAGFKESLQFAAVRAIRSQCRWRFQW